MDTVEGETLEKLSLLGSVWDRRVIFVGAGGERNYCL